MDAAEKYFALEQYLTPDEFGRLDENSTVIYVAEYYYGIAEQRKVDLAVRRVHKLIKLTQETACVLSTMLALSPYVCSFARSLAHARCSNRTLPTPCS